MISLTRPFFLFVFCLVSLLSLLALRERAIADPTTISQCIGDGCSADASYNCDFAHANPSTTDTAACQLTCAKRGAQVLACTRIDSHGGGRCGTITDTVVCSK